MTCEFPRRTARESSRGVGRRGRTSGGAEGATVRNLSGTRERAGMGTLESVDDGVTRQRAPTEELAEHDALRGRSQAPGQRGTGRCNVSKPEQPEAVGFVDRHVGPADHDVEAMLASLGHPTLQALVKAPVPPASLRHEYLR